MLSAPPLPGFTSLLSLPRVFLPDVSCSRIPVLHTYSCLISYFSSPVDRSSFLLYPQPNIPFFSFLLFFFLLLSLSARSTSSSLFSVSGRFQPSSPARASCDTRLIPPFVWHSKRTNNATWTRRILDHRLELTASHLKPAPVFPPNYDPDQDAASRSSKREGIWLTNDDSKLRFFHHLNLATREFQLLNSRDV